MKLNQCFLQKIIIVLCILLLTHLLTSRTNWKQTIYCRFAQFAHWVLLKIIFYGFLITFCVNEMPTCLENNMTVKWLFFFSFNHLLISIGELHETHELELLLLLTLTTDYAHLALLLRFLLLLHFLFILHFISYLLELVAIGLFKLFLVWFELCFHLFLLLLKLSLPFLGFQLCLFVERFHWVLYFHMALLRLTANYFDQSFMKNWKIRFFLL